MGASTNSRPLTIMTAAVTALAMPQNNTYARVSVKVSPEIKSRSVAVSTIYHAFYIQDYIRLTRKIVFYFTQHCIILSLPAIRRQMIHMEKATTIITGSYGRKIRETH